MGFLRRRRRRRRRTFYFPKGKEKKNFGKKCRSPVVLFIAIFIFFCHRHISLFTVVERERERERESEGALFPVKIREERWPNELFL